MSGERHKPDNKQDSKKEISFFGPVQKFIRIKAKKCLAGSAPQVLRRPYLVRQFFALKENVFAPRQNGAPIKNRRPAAPTTPKCSFQQQSLSDSAAPAIIIIVAATEVLRG